MSLRRGAIRERLRRGADRTPGTLYVDECEDGSTKVRARRGITSSLSPPRQRGSECKYSSQAGLEREEIVHLKAFPKDLSAALASSPLFKDAKFHKDIAMARAGEGENFEFQMWWEDSARRSVTVLDMQPLPMDQTVSKTQTVALKTDATQPVSTW